MATVSVVIPCYAQAHFLSDALESVLRQTRSAHEIIVVDDGSPDHVQDVAARYPGVRCVSQANQGLSAARNRGLRESTGEFIVFLDADDRLLPHALATGAAVLEARPACALTWGFRRLIDVSGRPAPDDVDAPLAIGRARYEDMLRENIIGPPVVVMFRRRVFEELGGFLLEQRTSEDYEMYLRVSRTLDTWGHGTVVAEYRLHDANMSLNHAAMLAGNLMALDRQEAFAAQRPDLRRAIRTGRRLAHEREDGGSLQHALSQHVRTGQWRKAVTGSLVLLWKYPRMFVPALLRRGLHALTGRRLRPRVRRIAPE